MKRLLAFVLLTSALCLAQGGTTSSDILPANTGQNLGSSDYRWNLYAQILDVSGAQTFPNVNGVLALDGTKYAYTPAGLTSMLSDMTGVQYSTTRPGYIPAGDVVATTPVTFTVPSGSHLDGAGSQASRIRGTATATDAIFIKLGSSPGTVNAVNTVISNLSGYCGTDHGNTNCTVFYSNNINENSGWEHVSAGTYGAKYGFLIDGSSPGGFTGNWHMTDVTMCCGGNGVGSRGILALNAYNGHLKNISINCDFTPYCEVGLEARTDANGTDRGTQLEVDGFHAEGVTTDDILVGGGTGKTSLKVTGLSDTGAPVNVVHITAGTKLVVLSDIKWTNPTTNGVTNDITGTVLTAASTLGAIPYYYFRYGGTGDGWDEYWVDITGPHYKGHGLKIDSSDAMEAVLTLRGGTTTDTTTGIRYNDHTNTTKFLEYRDTAGTLRIDTDVAGWIPFQISRGGGNVNFNSTGSASINFNQGGSGGTANGTGGVKFYSGGASPAQVASVDATGMVTASNGFAITNRLSSGTAPTIASGFGALGTPTITNANGTAVFVLTIGTGGTASTGILTMPTAAHGWACDATDVTNTTVNVYITKQTGYTTTSVTLTQFNNSAVATPWAASDQLLVKCSGF